MSGSKSVTTSPAPVGVGVFNHASSKSGGLRSNNPGNIRLSKVAYEGEIQGVRKDFKTFKTIEYGYRAIFSLITYYYQNLAITTINGVMNRYAPPSENDTTSYASAVAAAAGIPGDKKFNLDKQTLVKIVTAISKRENGETPVASEVQGGYDLYYESYKKQNKL